MTGEPFVTTELSSPECLSLDFSGDWRLTAPFTEKQSVFTAVEQSTVRQIVFSFKHLGDWDSSLIAFLLDLTNAAKAKGTAIDMTGAPEGVARLVALAQTVPAHVPPHEKKDPDDVFTFIGGKTLDAVTAVRSSFSFLSQIKEAFLRLFAGQSVMRSVDLLTEIQDAGVRSLPIVSLISFMVGLILAFVGAIQLRLFGAQIYVAALVAIAMSRVLAAVMTAVIMAGRTGAAYAATIGTMQVNEEIDALETMGVSPYDFLVLPKILALALMMPLLSVYANLMSMLGGAFVGIFMLDLTPHEYFDMTLKSLFVKNINIGLIQSFVFGIIVALCGCYCGIKCERDAASVGRSTTTAVVYSIVWIVVATGIITVICNALGV